MGNKTIIRNKHGFRVAKVKRRKAIIDRPPCINFRRCNIEHYAELEWKWAGRFPARIFCQKCLQIVQEIDDNMLMTQIAFGYLNI